MRGNNSIFVKSTKDYCGLIKTRIMVSDKENLSHEMFCCYNKEIVNILNRPDAMMIGIFKHRKSVWHDTPLNTSTSAFICKVLPNGQQNSLKDHLLSGVVAGGQGGTCPP